MTEYGETKSRLEEELQHAGPDTLTWYRKLLARRRVEKTKEVQGNANLSEEERLIVLDQARKKAQYGNADSEKMARDWERRNQRPPIGGSQDN